MRMLVKNKNLSYQYIFLFLLIYILTASVYADELLFKSDKVIRYSDNHISPNKKIIALGLWGVKKGVNKETKIYIQDLTVIDLVSGVPIAQLALPDELKHKGYVEYNSICWDSSSKNILFVFGSEPSEIYKWEIGTGQVTKIIQEPKKYFSLLSISRDGNFLAYIEYPYSLKSSSPVGGSLKVYSFSNRKSVQIADNVEPVRPIWLDDKRLIFSKKRIIYSSVMLGSPHKIAEIGSGEIINSFIEISSRKFAIVASKQSPEESKEFSKHLKEESTKVGFHKEIWLFDDQIMSHIISFRTALPGIAINERQALIPLSKELIVGVDPLEEDSSTVVRYELQNKEITAVTQAPGKYDLPILLSDSEILVRKNNKQLVKISLK